MEEARGSASPQVRRVRGAREEEGAPAVLEYQRLKESAAEEPRARRRVPETDEERKEQMMQDYSKRLMKSIE